MCRPRVLYADTLRSLCLVSTERDIVDLMWCCLQASRTEPEDILRMLNAEFPEPETGAALWTLQNDEENLLYVTTGSETALHLNADYVITCAVKR